MKTIVDLINNKVECNNSFNEIKDQIKIDKISNEKTKKKFKTLNFSFVCGCAIIICLSLVSIIYGINKKNNLEYDVVLTNVGNTSDLIYYDIRSYKSQYDYDDEIEIIVNLGKNEKYNDLIENGDLSIRILSENFEITEYEATIENFEKDKYNATYKNGRYKLPIQKKFIIKLSKKYSLPHLEELDIFIKFNCVDDISEKYKEQCSFVDFDNPYFINLKLNYVCDSLGTIFAAINDESKQKEEKDNLFYKSINRIQKYTVETGDKVLMRNVASYIIGDDVYVIIDENDINTITFYSSLRRAKVTLVETEESYVTTGYNDCYQKITSGDNNQVREGLLGLISMCFSGYYHGEYDLINNANIIVTNTDIIDFSRVDFATAELEASCRYTHTIELKDNGTIYANTFEN